MKKAWGIVLLVVILGVAIPFVQHLQKKQEAFTPDNLIRIHVVANSNSPVDQNIKLKVKDHLVNWLSPELAVSESANMSRTILAQNLDAIREEVCQVVNANRGDYEVSVSLGNYDFPTRSYGEVVLPNGNYQALKVILGKGKGANWWCVLYPPLCIGKAAEVKAGENPEWLFSKISPNFKKKLVRE